MKKKCLSNVNFLLYDFNDNIECFFLNYDELSRYCSLRIYDLNYYFKKYQDKRDFIVIKVDGKEYKLYKFDDYYPCI